ncbi:MAG: hypothetical protein IPM47_20490 [Sphingobacteriales bacterium]|nr:MAG: hypothetical protein IPM47_20490 [Sphingobacteriales bacterium]
MPIQKLSPNFEAPVGVETNNYQYNGKELNDDFGLHWSHHEYRFLDLQTNRWMSIDPLADKNNSVSGYSFVHNNPIRYRDPFGLDTLPNNPDGIPEKMLEEVVIKATKINNTHSENIRWHMKQGHQRMVKSTKGKYKPILFGPRNTTGIGDYAYQEGLGKLSYPIMATLSGAGLALFAPAMPPLLEQQSIGILSTKFVASGLMQGLVNNEIDAVDLLGDTFFTPFYSGLAGGLGDFGYNLSSGSYFGRHFGINGTKSGTNFLLDFSFSFGVGLKHTASESMFRSFVGLSKKAETPLYYFLLTSPSMSGLNYGGNLISKQTVEENK